MQVPELLAPAGGVDAFRAAMAAGADAVYLGLGTLNARAANGGLTLSELKGACAIAHRRGARVYVTLNVALCSGELDEAVGLARRARDAGADAVIAADAGFIRRLVREVPGIEVHLSTQAGAQDPAAVRFAVRELGVSRVTCARELTLPELSDLCSTGVPIEAFCHGALCVCYSGACFYSALMRGRSAMRGDCTQPCRAGYLLTDGAGSVLAGPSGDASSRSRLGLLGDRLLSPRDYRLLRHLPGLVRAGVASLKIEGRMKNPDYVYNVVRCYRMAIDAVAEGHALSGERLDQVEAQLARSFNRGFTDAYLLGESGSGLMSVERSINQGLLVGTLVARGYKQVEVELVRDVSAGDTLEIRSTPASDAPRDVPERWPMVPCAQDASAGQRVWLPCKRRVEIGSPVHVVRSARVIEAASRAIGRIRDEEERTGIVVDAAFAAPPADALRAKGSSGSSGGRGGCGGRKDEGRPACEMAVPLANPLTVADDPAEARRILEHGGQPAVLAHRLLEADGPAWGEIIPQLTVILDEVHRASDASRVEGLCRAARAIICRNLGQIPIVREAGASWGVASPIPVWNAETVRWARDLGARMVWVPEELKAPEELETLGGLDAFGEPDAALGPGDETASAKTCGRAPLRSAPASDRFVYRPPAGAGALMVLEHCLLTAEGPCARTAREQKGDPEARRACATCPRRLESLRGGRLLHERSPRAGARPMTVAVRVDALGRTRLFSPASSDSPRAGSDVGPDI